MTQQNKILATDLDGTLIPLDGHAQHVFALRQISRKISRCRVQLAFVTGRRLESVLQAIHEFELPQPDWIVCDVGTSVYQRHDAGEFVASAEFAKRLTKIITPNLLSQVSNHLNAITGLRLQEPEHQGPFKRNYYTDASELDQLADQILRTLDPAGIPIQLIASIDPQSDNGLIDILPRSVDKAFALQWLANENGWHHDRIVFAGDSGNDLAALSVGFRSIMVANAGSRLIAQVQEIHRREKFQDRLFVADHESTSGVMQGCEFFGVFQ